MTEERAILAGGCFWGMQDLIPDGCALGDRAHARYVERKPMRECVPSQNGFVALPPQRQSRACVTHATTRPVPLVISRLPRTCSGPSSSGSIASGPLRAASDCTSPVAGSPLAANLTSWCEPSQNGLLFEAPQRHSVAR